MAYRSTLYKCGFILSFSSLILNILAYATPYWIQSWTKVHTQFKRLGMWQVCFNGYRNERVLESRGHFGCWWMLSTQIDDLDEWIQPVWFKFVQAMSTFVILLLLVTFFMLLLQFCECCRPRDYLRILLAAVIMEGLAAGLEAVCVVLFGVKAVDKFWLPGPKYNYLSWSYGFAIITVFFAIFTTCCLALEYRKMRRLAQYREAAESAEAEAGGVKY